VGGRNGEVTVSLAPTDPRFPTFPNVPPAFPPGAVLPPRDIQEISSDYINLVGNARFGQHSRGSSVFPGRQFQFAATYRF
jgi:hypothetical protein